VNLQRNLTLNQDNLGFWTTNDDLNRVTVIATDYISYAVLASCYNKYGSNVVVLTRKININQDIYDYIYAAIDGINFSTNYLVNTQFGSITCASCSLSGALSYSMFLFNFIAWVSIRKA
jgi:hypothetical protein